MRAALPVLTVVAILGLGVASTSSGSGPQEIRLRWIQTSNHPNGKKGSWTSTLVNDTRQFGRPAGTTVGAEVGFSDGPRLVGAVRLPGGVLEYSGKAKHLPRHAGIVLPVIDGSGNFAGVTGTYTLSGSDAAHGKNVILVLRLEYD
jgi:hypothetical protein